MKKFERREKVRVKSGTCEGWIGRVAGTSADDPNIYCLVFDGDKGKFRDISERVGWFRAEELEPAA